METQTHIQCDPKLVTHFNTLFWLLWLSRFTAVKVITVESCTEMTYNKEECRVSHTFLYLWRPTAISALPATYSIFGAVHSPLSLSHTNMLCVSPHIDFTWAGICNQLTSVQSPLPLPLVFYEGLLVPFCKVCKYTWLVWCYSVPSLFLSFQ